ncbi:mechanosensitive ion channel family protein [Alkalimarinus alittae]|uniref:Small-conductance mechanosensitive channel n=1 Tax=Alkalimarinus alittae TaxID=2961619 RepID=A0ABY6N050_9ALTE|nr:mechanosensitive ion channel family protein [Alkalimarinus alittae]UZE95402.1 mechanosensitive ion channel family protein [Alkalimarinus alittae]
MQTVIFDWMAEYKLNLAVTVVILAIYFVFRFVAGPRIRKQAAHGRLKDEAISKALSTLNILLVIGALASSLIVWGFDFKGLLTLSASILAVTGVALFASWSILSNVTAFFLLLAHTSYRRGNFIRVIEADNYIEGYISEINLFNTKLISEDREVIIYPNNLLLSRPTIVNPRDRLQGVGKIPLPVHKEP